MMHMSQKKFHFLRSVSFYALRNLSMVNILIILITQIW